MNLIDYFDKIYIVHLPEKVDRYQSIKQELGYLSIDILDAKVSIPDAPRPETDNGFFSKVAYGVFLSHLDILEQALKEKFGKILVLEDDAIFSRNMIRNQDSIVDVLKNRPWDFCFLGHFLHSELRREKKGLIQTHLLFKWSHCYAVNASLMPRLIQYLKGTINTPSGHPAGGKMHIDAAYSFFRKKNPDVVTLVSNPVMSVQKGVPGPRWYDHFPITAGIVSVIRALRDELWRITGFYITKPF